MTLYGIAIVSIIIIILIAILIYASGNSSSPPNVSFSAPIHQIFVTNKGSDSVSAINATNYTVVKTINGFSGPSAIIISPDGTQAFVTNSGNDTISIINTATDLLVKNIMVGPNPSGIAFSPNGAFAYITNNNGGLNSTVSVINTTTDLVVNTIPLEYEAQGKVIPSSGAEGISVSPNGTQIFVAVPGTGAVAIINALSNKVVNYIWLYYFDSSLRTYIGHRPYGIVFSPDGTKAFISTSDASEVYVINATTDMLAKNISGLGNSDPYGSEIAISPNGVQVFVTNVSSVSHSPNGTISAINTTTYKIIRTISVAPPYGIVASPSGAQIVTTDPSGDSISIINTTNYTTIKTIGVGVEPTGIAIT